MKAANVKCMKLYTRGPIYLQKKKKRTTHRNIQIVCSRAISVCRSHCNDTILPERQSKVANVARAART